MSILRHVAFDNLPVRTVKAAVGFAFGVGITLALSVAAASQLTAPAVGKLKR